MEVGWSELEVALRSGRCLTGNVPLVMFIAFVHSICFFIVVVIFHRCSSH
jgi:hypothetical protein